jgi:hypothetical protein
VNLLRNIINALAVQTPEVIVIAGVPVKPFELAADFDFLDFPQFRKDLKIPVNRSKADTGKKPPDHFVDFVGAWMGHDFSKLLQNDLALARHSELRIVKQN